MRPKASQSGVVSSRGYKRGRIIKGAERRSSRDLPPAEGRPVGGVRGGGSPPAQHHPLLQQQQQQQIFYNLKGLKTLTTLTTLLILLLSVLLL